MSPVQTQRVVLAYSGSLSSSAAVPWLVETHRLDVVAAIVDVGQTDDLEELRARALACGATRAHVIDRRDAFARAAVLPAIAAPTPLDAEALLRLPEPIIAATLVEVAAIEGAVAVAHASRERSFDGCLADIEPALKVIAPAREWRERGIGVPDYARAHHLPPASTRAERHLLIRRVAPALLQSDGSARVTIAFDAGVPVSVNGVEMTLEELIESVSLIGGQYGFGDGAVPAPAAVVLRAAYAASAGHGSAPVRLEQGSLVVAERESRPALVNHS